MSWKNCLENNEAIKTSKDIGKAKSLIEMADERLHFFQNINTNYNIVFENMYSSLLEYLHALCILDGYKIKNHVCLGYYLRDYLKREDLYFLFDDCRYKRNSIVYYGKQMDTATAKEGIQKTRRVIKELRQMVHLE